MKLGRHMNVVAILRSGEAGEALNQACTGMNGTQMSVHVGKLQDVRFGARELNEPDVLLLDVDPENAEDVAHLERILKSEFPNTPVVATAPETTLRGVRLLMRLGVVDFIPQPIMRSDLMSALEHARQIRTDKDAPADQGGKVISFVKAGGGVGATTLAVQAACSLASRNKADGPGVCLLDLDIQFGTAALYLDLDNRLGLANLLESSDRMDHELLRSVMGRHECGLDVLAAPRDMVGLDALTPEFVTDCLRLVASQYATVILDLPEAWTPWTYRAMESSDVIVLVMQLTVASVRQARRQLDTMRAHGLEEVPVKVVLNRFEKGWGKSIHFKEAESALGRKFDYFVPNDFTLVSEALNQGVALSGIKRKSKVEKGIRNMIDESLRSITGEEERSEPRLFSALRR